MSAPRKTRISSDGRLEERLPRALADPVDDVVETAVPAIVKRALQSEGSHAGAATPGQARARAQAEGRTRLEQSLAPGLPKPLLSATSTRELRESPVAALRDTNLSTVLLGRFNPLIFSPEWLEAHKIIGPEEAASARESGIEVMAPNITSINFGSMKLVVEEERFMLIVGDEPLVRAKDFSVTCFNLLRHTPVHAVGLNYNSTLVGADKEKWHRFGDTLAPKEPWGDFLTGPDAERLGGLRALVLERQKGPDDRWAYTRLTIDVAENLPPMHATLNVNNHFKLGDVGRPQSGAEAYKLIDEVWNDAMERSKELTEKVRCVADVA